MTNKKIINALKNIKNDVPPIWLMRQAGRFLPEYREVREHLGSFLNLCYSPKDAAEVTLQPVRRFGFDAAIIFSDILVIPDALGVDVSFVQGEGPKLSPIQSAQDIKKLDVDKVISHLNPVFEALKLTKEHLPESAALIGFAGAPWTVSTYMIEGGGSKDFSTTKKFVFENPKLYQELQEILIQATSLYLIEQIKSGAEVIQLFDSWSGVLAHEEFRDLVIKPAKKIVENIKKYSPDTPIIGFPKGAGFFYEEYIKEVPVDGVSIDYTVPLEWAAENLQPHVCVQGNLDPVILATSQELIRKRAREIKDILGNGRFIFNLGHGILPYTPIENVELLVDIVRNE